MISSRLPGGLAALALLGGAAASVLALLAAPALADPPGRYVPSGLTQTVPTAHFVLHYNPSTPSPVSGMTIEQYAQTGAVDLEEAYGHLVTGGGLTPNAGLRKPTPDDDSKTDVYFAAPTNSPGFQGGIVYSDTGAWQSAYLFLTPTMSRTGFRFRSAHEFMHVIQDAYFFRTNDGLFEAFANWASEYSLSGIDPLDNNFSRPWLPLDCVFQTWNGQQCGSGYGQWLFIQAQVEDYGPGFVTGYYDCFASYCASTFAVAPMLDREIKAVSGNSQSLSTRFATYARDVWDPTRWTTDAIRRLRDEDGTIPASTVYTRATPDSGWKQVAIDHLAARYVRVRNDPQNAGTGDVVVLSWQRPDGMAAAVTPIVAHVGQEAWTDAGSSAGNQGSVTLDFGPGVDNVVLPLVNDSMSADNQQFAYRVQIIPAPDTTPPQTRIRKHPPKRTSSRAATFAFAASESASFECSLDRHKRFKPCRSPKRLRLKLGHHSFRVRAVDAAGNVDASPATWRWTVTKRR